MTQSDITLLMEKADRLKELAVELRQAIEYAACNVSIQQAEAVKTHGRDYYIVYNKLAEQRYSGSLRKCTNFCTTRSLKYMIINL